MRKRAYEKLCEVVYLMDSRLAVSEANEILRTVLPATRFRTIGGLVLERMRRIPREGEFIIEGGYRFTVLEANERGILKLRVELENAGAKGVKSRQ